MDGNRGAGAPAPLTAYQWRLIGFLSVATFFEGYDFLALSQILPELRAEWSLTEGQAGALVAVANVGTVAAYGLVRLADRWGRRPVLTLTIAGYTIATLLSGFAPDVWAFGILQLLARVFLIAEWAICMVYAAEEFPADRRGLVIGVIQAFSAFGAIFCAAVVPALVRFGSWRAVFFAGILPLILVAFARRSLAETKRFEARDTRAPRDFFAVWRLGYGRRLLQIAAIWAATYLCTQTGVAFWKEFVTRERGFTNDDVALSMTIAALGSLPLLFGVGKLIDVLGRRKGAVVIFVLTALGVLGSYNLHGQTALTAALVLGIFGSSAVLPVLNAFTTELFPTEVRSDAYAWANNLLGRTSYVLAPLVVGQLATTWGWGPSVSLTVVGPVVALVLILAWMPETRGRELEDSAALH